MLIRGLVVLVLVLCSACSLAKGPRVAPSERIYTVAKGDTVERIAHRSGVPAQDILDYNGIKDPKTIRPGQIVKIPAVGPLYNESAFQPDSQEIGVRKISISHVKKYVGSFSFPVHGARFTSPFGWRSGRFHEGADFAAPEGTPIHAAHDGVVVLESNSHGKYGRIVVIKGDGLLTVYGHNSRNRVKVGDRVSKGEHIADVGETGRASGPHLHFETRVLDQKGRYSAVDPYIFFVALKT